MPVVVFFGRPSSTSAHSAGVEREGGRCSWMCSFCMSVRPLAQTGDPDGKSGQANCTASAYSRREQSGSGKRVGGFNVTAPAASR